VAELPYLKSQRKGATFSVALCLDRWVLGCASLVVFSYVVFSVRHSYILSQRKTLQIDGTPELGNTDIMNKSDKLTCSVARS
jgi:hypothetical protein